MQGFLEKTVESFRCRFFFEKAVENFRCKVFFEKKVESFRCKVFVEKPVESFRCKVFFEKNSWKLQMQGFFSKKQLKASDARFFFEKKVERFRNRMWKIQQDVRVLACISGAYDFSHLKHVSCKMQGNLTSPSFQPRVVLFLLWLYFWGWGHVSSAWLWVLVPTLSASILAGMGAVDPKSSIHRGYK